MIVCTVYLYIATFGANVRSCRSQGEVGGTVASDWVTNLDRYGDPVLPWSRAHNLLASGLKGPRSAHRAICDILGMSAGECAGHAPAGRARQPAEPFNGQAASDRGERNQRGLVTR